MKTLVKNYLSLMSIRDETPVQMGEVIKVGMISIINKDNDIILYENVTLPENYMGKKFYFDGTDWSMHPPGK
jgi:hypothetical protein